MTHQLHLKKFPKNTRKRNWVQERSKKLTDDKNSLSFIADKKSWITPDSPHLKNELHTSKTITAPVAPNRKQKENTLKTYQN